MVHSFGLGYGEHKTWKIVAFGGLYLGPHQPDYIQVYYSGEVSTDNDICI